MTTGTPEKLMLINIRAEHEHFFHDDSRSTNPEFVLIMGTGVCGKTTKRHAEFAKGYVNVDAGDIFRRIEGERIMDFPGESRPAIDTIGQLVAGRAVHERRNIVTEIHHAGYPATKALIDALTAIGYKTRVIFIELDFEEAQRRNLARGPHNISAYYTDEFHVRWLMDAVARENKPASGGLAA